MTSSPRIGYHSWTLAPVLACLAGLAGCSSGTQTSPAPTASTSPTTTGAALPANPAGPDSAAVPSGALPLLAAKATRASYTIDGAVKEFLVFAAEKVTVSASCARPDGTLDCDAMRLLRRGKTVKLAPAELSMGIPPGAVICKKLTIPSTVGRDATGNEDGFCVFADGSMASHGSVDSNVLAP